ncbi:hypothetical protein ANCCAN_28487 [Ancylostoma caninum]|uniref:Uncharacterized protein n=1 Tax=Ancylostoma caninum TaxID=29170 RepID=A0A368F2D3_ANCCA|nr:hypothetical protein ANCCAN_28487 [Ancylostoma caninum]
MNSCAPLENQRKFKKLFCDSLRNLCILPRNQKNRNKNKCRSPLLSLWRQQRKFKKLSCGSLSNLCIPPRNQKSQHASRWSQYFIQQKNRKSHGDERK